jgi:hypothetical protein
VLRPFLFHAGYWFGFRTNSLGLTGADAPSLPLCHPPAAGHANPRKGDMRRSVHMIKLTATQKITPYRWVHPDDER